MDFYSQIGLTGQGYSRMFENDSMKVSTLLKIAEVLQVSVTELLGEKLTQKITKENQTQTIAWQTKLIECNEKKDELYEKLHIADREMIEVLKKHNNEILTIKSKQSASSK